MKTLIENARIVCPATDRDETGSLAIADGLIVATGGFTPDARIDAAGAVLAPGLVDLQARLRAPGSAAEGSIDSELRAAVAGGVTTLVCPPDTDPVLDEPGLVDMLRTRCERAGLARVLPLGALTRGLQGEALAEMDALINAGCAALTQSETVMRNTSTLLRALQYAASYGHAVWLRPQEHSLSNGVAGAGALATRLGLAGVPVMAETIALHTLFELQRATGVRLHLQRLSTAAGVELLRAAKREGLAVTADVSVHSLHLTDLDIGFFDSAARLNPPLRQARDRDALREALADGTLDALVSDHTPLGADAKTLPFAEAEPGASSVELLLGLALLWAEQRGAGLREALAPVTQRAAAVLGREASLAVGQPADLVLFDPEARAPVEPERFLSKGKSTPFAFSSSGLELPGRVLGSWVGGTRVFTA